MVVSGTMAKTALSVIGTLFTVSFWLIYHIGLQHAESEREISSLLAHMDGVQERADRTDISLREFKKPGERFTAEHGESIRREILNMEGRIGRLERYLYGGWAEKDKWGEGKGDD